MDLLLWMLSLTVYCDEFKENLSAGKGEKLIVSFFIRFMIKWKSIIEEEKKNMVALQIAFIFEI